MSVRRRVGSAALALLALTGTSACGSDESAPAELSISGAWARPTPATATDGVVYLEFTSDIDDTIVGAAVAPEIAATASLHRTEAVEGEGGSDHSRHGGSGSESQMTMQQLDVIEVVAGDTYEFSPGGNHVLLEDLVAPLTEGDEFTLTLELASGRTPKVDVIVANNPPE